MTDHPVMPARPLITIGNAEAEVCVDGWCGPGTAEVDTDADAGRVAQPDARGGPGDDTEI